MQSSGWTEAGTAVRLLTAAWTAAGIVLWLMFPMTAPVLLPLCAIAPLAWYWGTKRQLRWHRPSAIAGALALAGVYLFINATWSLSPPSAFAAVALIFVTVAVLHIVLNTLPDLDAPPLRSMAAGTLVGLAVAGTLLCVEIFSEQALRRALMRLVPQLQPNPLHLEMGVGGAARLMPYLPNLSISALTLLFWPAALIACRLGLPRSHRLGVLVASAVAAATVLASEHATSKVAFAGAALVYALHLARPRLARHLVLAGWVTATLLVVPIVSSLYAAGAQRAAWLPESARHRVVIWGFTSGEVVKAPLLGAGIGTARALHEARSSDAPRAPDTKFQLGTSLHSHNAYLQVWFEAGAAGALILLGLGLLVVRALRKFPLNVQPHLAATFVAGALLAATSYSVWAPWLMASLAMACIFAGLGTALPTASENPE
jgi:O-antigen ligase